MCEILRYEKKENEQYFVALKGKSPFASLTARRKLQFSSTDSILTESVLLAGNELWAQYLRWTWTYAQKFLCVATRDKCRKENEDQMLNTSSTLKIWDKSNAEVKNIESIKLQKSNVIASE